ncbi:hypothetical protein D5F01_LYC24596 [Larimichthys crocea]|uniref:Uncharacterized protein n=1 Tax=Larimichthys crocea TaxID=215358 RepID=A0A6G0HE63_LARCR|nr:hypothetical protein D5F01_LYC24596 [Larimichthys crocea]
MPACFHVAADPANNNLTEHGYPVNFTLDDVDYCNLMYWIILPALGARVYRTCTESGRGAPTVPVPIQYREHERNLTNELNLNNQNALTVPRLNSRCAFSKVVPRDCEDVSEQFEPTALVHKRCTDRGFSDTGVRFTGCGVSLMQQKSALYTLGTEIICKPTAHNTHQVHTVNQYCESVVIPETLESPGVYMPNLYMKDVRGGDVHINTGGPFDMVVADAFNGFCPESDSASGYRRPFIFTTGRSERLNGSITRDPMMRAEAYTCMPTLLHPFSSALRAKNRHGSRNRDNEESNHKLFCNTLHMVEFEKGVLDPIGNPFRDTVERVNGDKRTTDIMQPLLGVAFCATYGIGLTSDKKLMCVKDETRETLVDRLAPRISGVGIFACNPIQTTSRLINPIFSRIFESNRYSRFFQW